MIMGDVIGKIFGGAPKATGPSQASLDAQQAQTDKIAKQEAAQSKKLSATKAVLAARSGSGQGITLNPSTGEAGVNSKLGGA